MRIQCDCGKFQADIEEFPKGTPGDCICYCDDCQTYMHSLGRVELLDAHGGSEIVPVYPSNVKIVSGVDQLRCSRLSPKGLFRFWTNCCRTPICNTRPGIPWAGISGHTFRVKDSRALLNTVGPVRARIFGKFARGGKPEGASAKTTFGDLKVIAPFMLRGFLFMRKKPSPFFEADGKTSVSAPRVLTLAERNKLRADLGFSTL